VVSVLTTIIGILIALGTAAAVDLPEPCAEYEFREWMCQIKGNKATLRIHDRLIILNQRGDDYAQVSFFEDRFHKVKDVEITVRDATGDVVATYSKDDLTKSCGFGVSHELYSDHCTYSTTIARPDYPFSIEYSYRQKISNLFFLRGPMASIWSTRSNPRERRARSGGKLSIFPRSIVTQCHPKWSTGLAELSW